MQNHFLIELVFLNTEHCLIQALKNSYITNCDVMRALFLSKNNEYLPVMNKAIHILCALIPSGS